MLRVPVGDRYVVDALRKGGFRLGGEQSGHIIFMDHSTTGDGIIAALKVLELMRRTGKKLSELKNQIPLFPQVREDFKVTQKPALDQFPEVQKAIQEGEAQLKGQGRVFVRYSGTEPKCRVMVEGTDESVIRLIAKNISQTIQKRVNGVSV
jgi:phosphoglucosamine mutase